MLHKSAIPAFVTAMPWEERKRGGRYYTRSYRDKDGQERREYIGTGELARIVSEQDTMRRAAQVAERERTTGRGRAPRGTGCPGPRARRGRRGTGEGASGGRGIPQT